MSKIHRTWCHKNIFLKNIKTVEENAHNIEFFKRHNFLHITMIPTLLNKNDIYVYQKERLKYIKKC